MMLRILGMLLILSFLAKVPQDVYLSETTSYPDVNQTELISVAPSDTYLLVPGPLRKYVQRFEREYQDHMGSNFKIQTLTVSFVDKYQGKKADRVVGLCHWGPIPRVSILRSWWGKAPEASREALVFHELGHCVLNEQHRADRLLLGRPASLMNPVVLDPRYYLPNRSYYLRELFSHARPRKPRLPDSDCGGALSP